MTEHVRVEDRGSMLDVPTEFDRTDLAAWYGAIPDTIRVDRIFRHFDVIRAEMHVGPAEWVEVGYFREDDPKPGTDAGWVAQRIENTPPTDPADAPGETLWKRHGEIA